MKKPRMLLWRTFSDLMPVCVDVPRFEPGHHAAAVLLQARAPRRARPGSPRARSRRRGAGAADHRRAPPASASRRAAADSAQQPGDAPELLGQPHALAFRGEQLGTVRGNAASRRGRPRGRAASRAPNASRDCARAISGAALQRLAQRAAQTVLVDEEADGVEPRCRLRADRAAGSRAAPQARARPAPSPCDRWLRAGCPASRPRPSASARGSRGSPRR